MSLQKWQLLAAKDVSPSPWFPIESRTYQLPNGKLIEDFTVTTIADVAMIVPITNEGKIVFVRQYKPGVDEITIEFPAGRIEPNHVDIEDTAMHELKEETGIIAGRLLSLGTIAGFPTKGSELINGFIARDLEFTGKQHLDETEDIEILQLTPGEVDDYIKSGKIMTSHTIAFWHILKLRYNTLIGA